MQKFIILFLIAVLIFPLIVSAKAGVGIGTGTIKIDEPLKPGGIYEFPSLGVSNTGDEPADYEMEIAYHSQQPQQRPSKEWFSFSPSLFYLEPKQSQRVVVKLTLPMKTKPGDYFAYLEVHPVVKAGPGATVGIAVATKLYFSVIPANAWQAITYRISSFWTIYSPWTWIVSGIALVAIIIAFLRKNFAFQIGVKKK
ncbi:MAG: fimbria/pilus periplasmic chaperone [Candidatus Nealsonbacteria bacterium]|nr:MAG: fimbria/pilus periplasmic chaperone [Candidatus Nealsonbacteria bacterium]